AMRPPVKSQPLRDSVTLGESPGAWPCGTLHRTFLFPPLNPPCDSPWGCEPGLQWRKGTRMCPFIYGSACVVKEWLTVKADRSGSARIIDSLASFRPANSGYLAGVP